MDPNRARALAAQIESMLSIQFGGGWEAIHADAKLHWGQEVLARLVLLVGEDDILHVSGWIAENETINGDIFACTEQRVIRARFTVQITNGRGKLEGEFWAQPLSDVRRVQVTKVGGMPTSSQDAWPSGISLIIEVAEPCGSLVLPISNVGVRTDRSLAALLPSLLKATTTHE